MSQYAKDMSIPMIERYHEFVANLPDYQIVFMSDDFATIGEKYISNNKLVSVFDKGYKNVYIVNREKWVGGISIGEFKKNFLINNVLRLSKGYVDGTIGISKEKVYHAMNEMGCEELPVLESGKQIGCVYKSHGIMGYGKKDIVKLQVLRWELVSKSVVKEFFAKKKILVSSSAGWLHGFLKAFPFLETDVYNDSMDKTAIEKGYDVLIYGADIWVNINLLKYRITELYLNLLAESMVRYLRSNDVEYIYFDVGSMLDDCSKRRTNLSEICALARVQFNDLNSYYKVTNTTKAREICSGRRITKHYKDHSKKIYMFGSCIALGGSAYNYEDSIESALQSIIENNNLDYQVVNCGDFVIFNRTFSDINDLYKIADTEFKSGDKVIHLGFDVYRNSRFIYKNLYFLREAFNIPKYKNVKCFFDPLSIPHMTTMGYRISAEYIFSCIKDKLLNNKEKVDNCCNSIALYNSSIYRHFWNDLANLIPKVSKEKLSLNSGIMFIENGIEPNQIKLIENAARQVDLLYLFINETKTTLSAKIIDDIRSGLKEANEKIIISPNPYIVRLVFQNTPIGVLFPFKEKYYPFEDPYFLSRYLVNNWGVIKYFSIHNVDVNIKEYQILIREMLEYYNVEFIVLQ